MEKTNDLQIRAFCSDFNWDLFGRPAPPGLYSHASPIEHVDFYESIGVNVIQTFAVSYNGYAWFQKSSFAPITPGLKTDYLNELCEIAHSRGIKVMGYFCLGSNPFWTMKHNSTVCHNLRNIAINSPYYPDNWIPFTENYLDYFCYIVSDTLKNTSIDGFMIDWFKVERSNEWLDNEKILYEQLLNEKFPSSEPSYEVTIEFKRRQIENAWNRIKSITQETRKAIIWTNHPFESVDDPIWNNSKLLKEVDWVLNESPNLKILEWLSSQVGNQTKIIQNFCGWINSDASSLKEIDTKKYGLYGFAQAHPTSTLPFNEEQKKNWMSSAFDKRIESDFNNLIEIKKHYLKLKKEASE